MNYRRLFVRGTLSLTAAVAAVAPGCTDVADAESPDGGTGVIPQELSISTKNYFFVTRDTIEAGLTNVRLINRADEMHHVQIVKLAEGRTVAELEAALESDPHGPMPDWLTFFGGPDVHAPGGESQATVDLEPGNYALICFIPSPKDGVPHLAKGMVRALTVVPSDRPKVPEPVADVVIELDDYEFNISHEIKAGRRTLRVVNAASQPHEVFIVKLAPGSTIEEFLEWASTLEGPPPGTPVGGTTLIHAGIVNHVTVDLTPGEYALLCFARDVHDGKSHIAHGMFQQITIS